MPFRRQWLRFSITTMLVVIAVVSVWLGMLVNSARRQREAVRVMVQLGGTVEFDFERAGQEQVDASAPKWLRELVGKNYFQKVTHVDLSSEDVGDEDLKHLRQFRNLRRLGLSNTKITDAGLEHIKELRSLEDLALIGCSAISDNGLRHIQGLKNLRYLDLTGTNVTDKGMQYIAPLSRLEQLELTGLTITDRGAEHLHRLANLKLLFFCRLGDDDLRPPLVTVEAVERLKRAIPGCKVVHEPPGDRAAAEARMRQVPLERKKKWEDIRQRAQQKVVVRNAEEAIAAIRALPAAVEQRNRDVIFVRLDNYQVNDEFLAHLRFLTYLEVLDLSRNPITNNGVKHLAALKNLRKLQLDGTRIGDGALQTIRHLTELRTLWLDKTDVGDQGLQHLEPLSKLEDLFFSDNPITDEGLNHIARLTNLRRLMLVRSNVTDAGLQHLHRLKNLELLDVSGTKVTELGAREFEKLQPNCKVELYRNAKR